MLNIQLWNLILEGHVSIFQKQRLYVAVGNNEMVYKYLYIYNNYKE